MRLLEQSLLQSLITSHNNSTGSQATICSSSAKSNVYGPRSSETQITCIRGSAQQVCPFPNSGNLRTSVSSSPHISPSPLSEDSVSFHTPPSSYLPSIFISLLISNPSLTPPPFLHNGKSRTPTYLPPPLPSNAPHRLPKPTSPPPSSPAS
jgi:hypothetical protein